MTIPRALIFDCDGVLVDSEKLAVAELSAMLHRAGVPMTDGEIYDRFLGRSGRDEIRWLRDHHGVDIQPLLPGYRDALAARFRRDLRAMPGMAQMIAGLWPVPRAVASSSAPDRLWLSLQLTGLWDHFAPHIYSAAQVENGKPAPDLFLMAAARLGVAPPDCVVIEDSPAGIQAARAAGMRVIGFLGGSHANPARLRDRLAALAPDALADHADELPAILARPD